MAVLGRAPLVFRSEGRPRPFGVLGVEVVDIQRDVGRVVVSGETTQGAREGRRRRLGI